MHKGVVCEHSGILLGHRQEWNLDSCNSIDFETVTLSEVSQAETDKHISSVQSLSRVRLFATPWTSGTPGLPVHCQLPEFTQTHAHWVDDAIQPSHPLSSPSPAALNPSQHQGLFQWVGSLHEMAKVLEFQLQHQSFSYMWNLKYNTKGWI